MTDDSRGGELRGEGRGRGERDPVSPASPLHPHPSSLSADDDFRDLVRKMRAKQRQFFATRPEDRPPQLIADAKALERQVDRALAPSPTPLFDREGPPWT